ncbi:hypothetical protein CFIMG_005185RA [Ceratocystis fimbriata CBS 114723]|uniref:Sister chromatid cohesion protein DCC1 n=1 Tax=Ceratocystis fimbriata CBS 114723 TaxID=1035309 RepID=A0A2C5WYN2_9PEZI|nr:hypothetical protein CFIMG_005185RA [Ceratocystis fimbriata CBS 114723]
MSSQGVGGIPFTYAPNNDGYRLLELPSELAAILDSPNAPTLYLETSPTTGLAVLRSPEHIYTLRQRNTSNSIILTQPTDHTVRNRSIDSDDQERDVSASPQKQGITAFATIHESIELIRQASDKPSDKAAAKPAVSMGKWHERFGKTR